MPKRYNFAELNWPGQLLPRAAHRLGIQMMMISAWLLVHMWTVSRKKLSSEVRVLSGFYASADRLTVSSRHSHFVAKPANIRHYVCSSVFFF